MNWLTKELFPRDHRHIPIFLVLMALLITLPTAIISIETPYRSSNASSVVVASALAGQVCNGTTVVCTDGYSCVQNTCQVNNSTAGTVKINLTKGTNLIALPFPSNQTLSASQLLT